MLWICLAPFIVIGFAAAGAVVVAWIEGPIDRDVLPPRPRREVR